MKSFAWMLIALTLLLISSASATQTDLGDRALKCRFTASGRLPYDSILTSANARPLDEVRIRTGFAPTEDGGFALSAAAVSSYFENQVELNLGDEFAEQIPNEDSIRVSLRRSDSAGSKVIELDVSYIARSETDYQSIPLLKALTSGIKSDFEVTVPTPSVRNEISSFTLKCRVVTDASLNPS